MFEIDPTALSSRDLIGIKQYRYPAFLQAKCGGMQLANIPGFKCNWFVPLKPAFSYQAYSGDSVMISEYKENCREFKLYDFTFFFDKKVGFYKEV